jgi:aspartyl-tRNA(Asn)/glutamyl-tRNA(Gln) amidotransferase subunit C
MKINNKLINDLAKLAKLEFNEQQSVEMQEDLKKIIGFVDKLSEINTENIEPLIYLSDEKNVLREDEIGSMLSQREALSNAPKKDSDYILVPKIIKK